MKADEAGLPRRKIGADVKFLFMVVLVFAVVVSAAAARLSGPSDRVLTGTGKADTLNGGAAADTIYGRAGNDRLDGYVL